MLSLDWEKTLCIMIKTLTHYALAILTYVSREQHKWKILQSNKRTKNRISYSVDTPPIFNMYKTLPCSINTLKTKASERIPPSLSNFFYITLKFTRHHLCKKKKKISISEPLRGQGAGIFEYVKALDISLIVYHWRAFSSLIWKRGVRNSNYLI